MLSCIVIPLRRFSLTAIRLPGTPFGLPLESPFTFSGTLILAMTQARLTIGQLCISTKPSAMNKPEGWLTWMDMLDCAPTGSIFSTVSRG